MNWGPWLIAWTIRVSLAFYVAALFVQLLAPRTLAWDRRARALWTAACVLLLAHLAAAFHYFHEWSHAAAFRHTERETQRLLGISFGYGIFFNHLFALVWLADVIWWWAAPQSHRARPRGVAWAVHSYMLFIVLNGAIVFEDGPVRAAGIAGAVALALALIWQTIAARPRLTGERL